MEDLGLPERVYKEFYPEDMYSEIPLTLDGKRELIPKNPAMDFKTHYRGKN